MLSSWVIEGKICGNSGKNHSFAKQLSKSQKSKIYFNQYLWHVFSFEKLVSLESQEAIDSFNKVKKKECYLFYQDNENA
ncbi:DUF4275 domain-containing protein [Cytobacillus oceanisediminis]|uniref:Uncharacterized protein DUF4275 n=1 Tax=Cytobacillus oceanisediminis TaxID=665099 RepID=A0A562J3T3_9BACI|nr:uncharacterized protein DUF4275 [Cytobacillus oceanisediminis]